MSLTHLNDKNFKEEVLDADLPVLVDFWADWCSPCKMLTPVIEEVAEEFAGRLKVAKLDIDAGKVTATKYGIMSIPTLIIFKGGKAVDQAVGALSKRDLVARIKENL
ncbi:MAG: thioredoxin [Candidatus Omnitrophota bacterium]